MRRRLINELIRLLRRMLATRTSSGGRRSRPRADSPGRRRVDAPARDAGTGGPVRFEYSPELDGEPDPGEVVWTWVPYEDDPSQGKDRPVVIVGRRGQRLVGVPLTSKRHDSEPQVPVGTGAWDREGRPSFAKLDRLVDVDPAQVRREGAVLPRDIYDDVVAGVRRVHR
jgi:hypothetical protein